MSDKKYGVFFWRKGDGVEHVPSEQNIAYSGVKPRRVFYDLFAAKDYAGKQNMTIPANLKNKYSYEYAGIVEPDRNGAKGLFKSGNVTEALKAQRASNEQINRNKIDAMIKEGIQDFLYKTRGAKR